VAWHKEGEQVVVDSVVVPDGVEYTVSYFFRTG